VHTLFMKTQKRLIEKDSKKIVSQDKLRKLYDACISNSRDLLAEAKILLNHQKYSRAHFLAIAAFEEIGKAKLIGDYSKDVISKNEFSDAFHKHEIKIAYNDRWMQVPFDEDSHVYYDKNAAQNAKKEREDVLYVSHDYEYEPVTPSMMTNEDIAKVWVQRIEDEINSIELGILKSPTLLEL
jgi:AbiV family abortive infection protein